MMKVTFSVLSIIPVISAISFFNCPICELYLPFSYYNPDNLSQFSCEGKIFPCETEQHICGYVYIIFTRSDLLREVIFRRICVHMEACNITQSFSTPGAKVLVSQQCCTSDDCTPIPPKLTQEKTKNGVRCPACFSYDKPCTPSHSMECTGKERYCLTFYRKYSAINQQVFTSGCATWLMCYKSQELKYLVTGRSKDRASCTKVSIKTNLAPGHFLWCETYHNFPGSSNKSSLRLCSPDEDVCVFEQKRYIQGENNTADIMISKRCGKSKECSRSGTIRSSNKTILINTTCCNQNVCKAPRPSLPSISSDENGLICPSYYNHKATTCPEFSKLKCTGNETRCVQYTRTESEDMYNDMETLHGCTTNEICEAGSSLIERDENNFRIIKTDIDCTGNGQIAQSSNIYSFLMITFSVFCALESDT